MLRLHRLFQRSLGNPSSACGTDPPTDQLAAHIKRRASSNRVERVDAANNVMAACALDCDSLYEHGYMAVDEVGTMITSATMTDVSSTLGRRLAELRGRRCSAFCEG